MINACAQTIRIMIIGSEDDGACHKISVTAFIFDMRAVGDLSTLLKTIISISPFYYFNKTRNGLSGAPLQEVGMKSVGINDVDYEYFNNRE